MRFLHIVLFSSIFISSTCYGQTKKEIFDELVQSEDTLTQQKMLNEWEKENSDDPDLNISYFNYYVNKSKKELITLGDNPNNKEAFVILSEDTTNKEPVGYMYSEIYYDEDTSGKAIEWIEKGIKKYPNRLDMRFGEIYYYGKMEDYESFTNKLVDAINQSAKNKNKWLWKDNEPVDEPEEMFLESLQSYIAQLFNTENDSLLDNVKQISNTVLKYYPKNVENISNLAVAYSYEKQYDRALELLLKAEKINKEDIIVLSNIAYLYKTQGENQNAIKYYNLVSKYGNEEDKEFAKEQIDAIQKE